MSVRTLPPRYHQDSILPIERRASPRRPCLREVSCQAVRTGKEESVPALLEDVSNGGLGLVVRRCYEPGRVLAVSWQHPLHGPKRTLLAQVVHCRNEGGGNWVVGCALASALTEEEVTALFKS